MCKKDIGNNNKLTKPHEMHHEDNAVNVMIKMDGNMQCQCHIQNQCRDQQMNNDHRVMVNTYNSQSVVMSDATTKADQIMGDNNMTKNWMENETAVVATNAVLSEYSKSRKPRML